MKCKRIEKWISDSIDKELSERKRKVLENHLESCASCRAYKNQIERIHSEIAKKQKTEVSLDHLNKFSEKLKASLSSLGQEKKYMVIHSLARKWIYAAASTVCVIFIIIFLTFHQNKPPQDWGMYVFSIEEGIGQIFQEISGDSDLEAVFSSMILVSIEQKLEESDLEGKYIFFNDPFFWKTLTEEELKFLESEINKDIKS